MNFNDSISNDGRKISWKNVASRKVSRRLAVTRATRYISVLVIRRASACLEEDGTRQREYEISRSSCERERVRTRWVRQRERDRGGREKGGECVHERTTTHCRHGVRKSGWMLDDPESGETLVTRVRSAWCRTVRSVIRACTSRVPLWYKTGNRLSRIELNWILIMFAVLFFFVFFFFFLLCKYTPRVWTDRSKSSAIIVDVLSFSQLIKKGIF